MDTLENIRTFLVVVRANNFSAAARAMDTVPSVISKRVGQLEHRLKAKLFERSTRRLTLTEVGERYYPRFLAIIAEVDKAFDDLAGSRARLEERLRVKCPTTLAVSYFGDVFANFQRAHPGVRMEIVLIDRSVNPVEEGFDLAVGALPSSYAGVTDVALCAMPRMIVASPVYLARQGTPVHPRDLMAHDCLAFRATGSLWQFEGPAGMIDINVPTIFSVNDSHVLLNAVEKDLGVTLIARHIVRPALERGSVVALLDDYPIPDLWVKALVPDSRSENAAVQALLKWLIDASQPLAPWDRAAVAQDDRHF